MNAGGAGYKRNYFQAHQEKKRWQSIYEGMLMAYKVKPGMSRCVVSVELKFVRKRRRDSENYRASFCKPFADALVCGLWIPDDSDEFFELTRVKIADGPFAAPRPGINGTMKIELLAFYD